MSGTGRRWRIGLRRVGRWYRHRGRFYVALVATVVVVAYAVVPWIVELLETLGGYNPSYYEPKDLQRQDYLKSLPGLGQGFFGWQTTFKLVLLVLVGLLWLIAVSGSSWRGSRPSRR